jgi:hypothetical protein
VCSTVDIEASYHLHNSLLLDKIQIQMLEDLILDGITFAFLYNLLTRWWPESFGQNFFCVCGMSYTNKWLCE